MGYKELLSMIFVYSYINGLYSKNIRGGKYNEKILKYVDDHFFNATHCQ